MGGGAGVVSALLALAQLECQRSVVALVPLCENMPSGNAVKPGDVVTAMNGKTIEVAIVEPLIMLTLSGPRSVLSRGVSCSISLVLIKHECPQGVPL